MTFRYICFISYVHSKSTMLREFVAELKQALVDELDPIFDEDVYIDKEGLQPGDHFNEELAKAICQSFCMVVVYVPKYESVCKSIVRWRYLSRSEWNLLEIQKPHTAG